MRIKGNVVLVTGGATGIGFALAKKFVEAGNEVIICGRREAKLKEAKDSADSSDVKIEEAVVKIGIRREDLETLSQDMPRKKRSRLNAFGVLLAAGIIMVVGGVLTSFVISLAGAALVLASLLLFMSYLRMDNVLTKSSEVLSLVRQRDEQNKKVNDLTAQIDKEVEQHGYKSLEDVEMALNSTLDELYTVVDSRSVQGLEAVVADMRGRLSKLELSNPQAKVGGLLNQIQEKELELGDLEKAKPNSKDMIVYDK